MYQRAVEYWVQANERTPHSIHVGPAGYAPGCATLPALRRSWTAGGRGPAIVSSGWSPPAANWPSRTRPSPRCGEDLCQAHFDLAHHQQQLGNAAEAAARSATSRELLENMPRETPQQLFELAMVYAALARRPKDAGEPNDEDAAEQQRNADLAMETLKKAIAAGYSSATTLKTSRLLDPLRERDDFQEIVANLAKSAEAQELASRNVGSTSQKLADRRQAAGYPPSAWSAGASRGAAPLHARGHTAVDRGDSDGP